MIKYWVGIGKSVDCGDEVGFKGVVKECDDKGV